MNTKEALQMANLIDSKNHLDSCFDKACQKVSKLQQEIQQLKARLETEKTDYKLLQRTTQRLRLTAESNEDRQKRYEQGVTDGLKQAKDTIHRRNTQIKDLKDKIKWQQGYIDRLEKGNV